MRLRRRRPGRGRRRSCSRTRARPTQVDDAGRPAASRPSPTWIADARRRRSTRRSASSSVDGQIEPVDTAVSFAGRRRRAKRRRRAEPDPAYAARAAAAHTLRLTAAASGRSPVRRRPASRLLEFLEVMRRLRAECAWKREQTHRSLARYLLEETHETLEAIDTGDADAPARGARRPAAAGLLPRGDRRGDRRRSPSTTWPRDIIDKMRRRNPHVFAADRRGPAPAGDAADDQRGLGGDQGAEKQRDSVTDGLPPGLPALLYADKVLDRLERAARCPCPSRLHRRGTRGPRRAAARPGRRGRASRRRPRAGAARRRTPPAVRPRRPRCRGSVPGIGSADAC